MAETTKSTPKWPEKTVEGLREGYVSQSIASVEDLMEQFGKSKREIVGKLVSMGIYSAPEKPAKKAKDEGPTKQDILDEIEALGFSTEGFAGVTKPALLALKDFVTRS